MTAAFAAPSKGVPRVMTVRVSSVIPETPESPWQSKPPIECATNTSLASVRPDLARQVVRCADAASASSRVLW